MDATGWIAAYAAVVATGALGWEIHRTRQTQAQAREAQALKVSIRLGSVLFLNGDKPDGWALHATVVNSGDYAVRVTEVAMIQQDTRVFTTMHGKELPGTVRAHDASVADLDDKAAGLKGFDPIRSLVVRVRLVTGEVLASEPYRLGS